MLVELSGRWLVLVREDRREAAAEGPFGHGVDEQTPQHRRREQTLNAQRPRELDVEPSIQQDDTLQTGRERTLLLPREQFLRHGRAVVVADEARLFDAKPPPEHLGQIGLLVDRVLVVARLVGVAEAEEVERQHAKGWLEQPRDRGPVPRARWEAVQERQPGSGARGSDEDVPRARLELDLDPLPGCEPAVRVHLPY